MYQKWLDGLNLHIDDRAYLVTYADEHWNGDVRAAAAALISRARLADREYMARVAGWPAGGDAERTDA